VAALRLAMERGPDNVRVDDIADAAGVSPRTYNNYSSREQAIVAAVPAERESRVAAAVADHPADAGLADAVIDAVIDQYTDPGDHAGDVLLMITTSPALRAAYVDTVTTIEAPLADAIAQRCDGMDQLTARVLSASVSAAVKVALRTWLQSATASASNSGLVVPSGSLPDLLRTALLPLVPGARCGRDTSEPLTALVRVGRAHSIDGFVRPARQNASDERAAQVFAVHLAVAP
jgi:AcrR family transcriptional regulator